MILKMKLTQAQVGSHAHIVGFVEEWDLKFQNRLVELGFGIGQEVFCVRKTPLKGPLVFKTGDALYSLGRDVTDFIIIQKRTE